VTLVRQFHEAFDLAAPGFPTGQPADVVRLRMRLIEEEFKEVMEELQALLYAADYEAYLVALGRLLKELADLRYVTDGCAVTFGLPIDEAFAEVHRSNMSKLGSDGRPVKDAGGKVLKGPNYTEADMSQFVPLIEGEIFP
jgi:predicted HAD superfamily Cof-like phosphohydrolase